MPTCKPQASSAQQQITPSAHLGERLTSALGKETFFTVFQCSCSQTEAIFHYSLCLAWCPWPCSIPASVCWNRAFASALSCPAPSELKQCASTATFFLRQKNYKIIGSYHGCVSSVLLYSSPSTLIFSSSSFQVLAATIQSFRTALAAPLVPCSALCPTFRRSLLRSLCSTILLSSFLSLGLPVISLPFFSVCLFPGTFLATPFHWNSIITSNIFILFFQASSHLLICSSTATFSALH